MASVWPAQLAALHAEIAEVLGWAWTRFPEGPGPLDEGHAWDCALAGSRELSAPETLHYDPARREISTECGPPGPPRHTVTLALSGNEAFCAAFRQRFGLD